MVSFVRVRSMAWCTTCPQPVRDLPADRPGDVPGDGPTVAHGLLPVPLALPTADPGRGACSTPTGAQVDSVTDGWNAGFRARRCRATASRP